MKSHEIDYKIIGEDIQLVEVELDPSEVVIAEAGSMCYLEDNIVFESKMGDGSEPEKGFFGKVFQAGSRALMGESIFLTHFTNKGNVKRKVAFSAPHPGTILPIDLSKISANTLIAQKDSFLCAALGTKISISFNQKLGTGVFGGEGFILQKIQGDGMVFIHGGGVIIEKFLNNETLRIDTGCIVAFESQLHYDIQRAGSLRSMVFGGEGIFLATLSGTGRVWIQSMPLSKLINTLSPVGNNTQRESGSVLGNITNIFE
ncbi:MAG: TIGR00266 family protein [Pseudarcicella sp.]|nr:TIGR00266 family protein [Pseudarcicella sp.]MBP6409836.1 TIGR00266 family protein [Pseudarcicella sp.]